MQSTVNDEKQCGALHEPYAEEATLTIDFAHAKPSPMNLVVDLWAQQAGFHSVCHLADNSPNPMWNVEESQILQICESLSPGSLPLVPPQHLGL